MTGLAGNSEFWVSGKQNSLFPLGPVIKCLLLNLRLDSITRHRLLVNYIVVKFSTTGYARRFQFLGSLETRSLDL